MVAFVIGIVVLAVIINFIKDLLITSNNRHDAAESWKAVSYDSPYAAHHMTCGEIERYAKEARAAKEKQDKEHNI